MMEAYRCISCGERYSASTHLWRCRCRGLFELAERLPFDPHAIHHHRQSLWRYQAMMALVDEPPVSLGEGLTPLIPLAIEDVEFLCKLEFLAPTGSFKDRGTTVLVSALRSWGIGEVVEDSSGNAGASLAAYCAYAGIRCRLYVPKHASAAKLAQITAYGAELIPVEGPRENAAQAAQAASKASYYASHAYHPLILEGMKTFAYELWEELGRQCPDAILFPTGQGTLLLGAYRGFVDLQRAALIDEIPRLIAVQASNCAPLYAAFEQGMADVPPDLQGSDTVAEGIRIVRPTRAAAILQAIRQTRGEVLTVSDEAILQAQKLLARRGLYVEPTSAVAVAGLLQWTRRREGTIVVPLTGSGLKSTALG